MFGFQISQLPLLFRAQERFKVANGRRLEAEGARHPRAASVSSELVRSSLDSIVRLLTTVPSVRALFAAPCLSACVPRW